ncbi:hypothetical protein D3C87_16980 [compost metagenome]
MRKSFCDIAAFSILELAIVLSLTGLFISLFFLSVNSFNKTMQQEITIKGELNSFFQFRSNFWQDLEKADSFQLSKDQLICFHTSIPIVYTITDEKLSRHHKDHHTLFEINALSIEKTTLGNHELVEFKLEWKNTPFSLKYPLQKQNSNYINTYFSKKLWKE